MKARVSVIGGRSRVASIQILDPRDPESAADRLRRLTSRARQQHESRAAVNREDSLAVVESGDGIDRRRDRTGERRSGAAPASLTQSGRQDEADAAAAANQLQRALDEQLIQIGVRRCARRDRCRTRGRSQ